MGRYVQLPVLRASLGEQGSGRDDLLEQAIDAAEAQIDLMTGRRFDLDTVATSRTFQATQTQTGGRLIVDDIGALGAVVETGSGVTYATISDVEYGRLNALSRGWPIEWISRPVSSWPAGRGQRVRVTARWGWPAVPAPIQRAALIQSARLFRRPSSPEGVLNNAEWGGIRVSRLDPDVAALVSHFAKPRIA